MWRPSAITNLSAVAAGSDVPDKCGYTKRTHAIFNCKVRNVFKKSDLACKQEDESTSHLNSMIIKPVNRVCVEFDEEKLRELEGGDKEITVPTAKKLGVWADNIMTDDPEDKRWTGPRSSGRKTKPIRSRSRRETNWETIASQGATHLTRRKAPLMQMLRIRTIGTTRRKVSLESR